MTKRSLLCKSRSFLKGQPSPLLILAFVLWSSSWIAFPVMAESEGSTAAEGSRARSEARTLDAMQPEGPNPYLSFLPTGAPADYRYWDAVAVQRSRERHLRLGKLVEALGSNESEPNETQATANFLADFGSGDGEASALDISGNFAATAAPTALGPFAEDEGAIPLATETGLTAGMAVTISGTIGDGPFGSGGTGTGDFDFFKISGVELGQLIVIDVNTIDPDGPLDPHLALYESNGDILRLNDDEDPPDNLDSFMAVPAPADGDYYVAISGSVFPFVSILSDPFDSASGMGVGSEGDYEITIRLEDGDPDWFSFDLEACDILGVNLVGAGNQVTVVGPAGEILVASTQDLSGIAYPPASMLPGGGNAVASYVASAPGRYAVRAFGAGGADYTLELRLFRQSLESSLTPKKIFVDFDGATLERAIFGLPPATISLSPLSSFLSGWGLGPSDEDAVIDATLVALKENLVQDPRNLGPNGQFAVEILNSRDHADPFGAGDTSRLIVGGSQSEFGFATIGIAQSIDPGNFEAAETALILLDLLSRPAPDPDSLNTFPRAPGVGIIELIGIALGNIAAHEAGHYTGSFHTEQFNPSANIMDRGGNLANTLGIGADGIFGTEDDEDVDFIADMFVPTEGFSGLEDTLAIMSCGCTSGGALFSDGFELGDVSRWSLVKP